MFVLAIIMSPENLLVSRKEKRDIIKIKTLREEKKEKGPYSYKGIISNKGV